MSSPAALSGELDDLGLADLLAWVGAAGPRGLVELDGATRGTIELIDGRIALASADDGPSLADMAIGSGAVSADGWESAERAVAEGRDLVDALLDAGADPVLLEGALREQTVGAFFEFLVPGRTSFRYYAEPAGLVGGRFAFTPSEVIDQAQERVAAWKTIAEAIPSTTVVVRLRRALDAPSISIDADDWRVLALVDGRATVAEIIGELGLSAFAVCGVLHRLMVSGAVETAT